jgi:hypothetical protein
MLCTPKNERENRELSGCGMCNPKCEHLEECKKELNLGEDWKFPYWHEYKEGHYKKYDWDDYWGDKKFPTNMA